MPSSSHAPPEVASFPTRGECPRLRTVVVYSGLFCVWDWSIVLVYLKTRGISSTIYRLSDKQVRYPRGNSGGDVLKTSFISLLVLREWYCHKLKDVLHRRAWRCFLRPHFWMKGIVDISNKLLRAHNSHSDTLWMSVVEMSEVGQTEWSDNEKRSLSINNTRLHSELIFFAIISQSQKISWHFENVWALQLSYIQNKG